ncbi:MAG TPA: condensation domain-containing protein [Vicinamibacterales bacterium]|nr:condensation domain-containing protein [Vicinamibacterales bacterium]
MNGDRPVKPPADADKREALARLLRERIAAPQVEHPLSFNQRSLWFMHRLAPGSAAYNVAYAFVVESPLDAAALRGAFERLTARHAILRTTYSAAAPVQVVHAGRPLDFAEVDARESAAADLDERLRAEAQRPFDLEHGPVFRVRVFTTADAPVLLVTFHHIAYDLWSMATFLAELGALYRAAATGAGPLPPPETQYVDFVRWQHERLAADGERLWTYWRGVLSGALPVLELPADHPRPPVQSFHGAVLSRGIPADLAARLRELARAEGVTLFVVLLAAYQLFLHRASGQPDVLVGTPMAGRSRAEFEQLIGYMLNSLPLRADFAADPPFRTVLRGARDQVRGALEHQDYPVELLVERLRPARSANQAPLFQTMFVLNQPHHVQGGIDLTAGAASAHDLRLRRLDLDLRIAQFDVSLEVVDLAEGLTCNWEYATDLFDEARVATWARQLEGVLAAIVEAPGDRTSELLARAAAPRTPSEEAVAEIFREMFGRERVTLDDSFLTAGGDADTARRIAGRLSSLTGVTVPLAAVFDAPTVAGLASLLEDALLGALGDGD